MRLDAAGRQAIDTALSADFDLGSHELIEVEQLGSAAFEEIISRLESGLPAPMAIRALSLLALLGRQACAGRKLEVIAVALQHAMDDDQGVRSRASALALAEASILEANPGIAKQNRYDAEARREFWERMTARVIAARSLGLDDSAAEMVDAFLKH